MTEGIDWKIPSFHDPMLLGPPGVKVDVWGHMTVSMIHGPRSNAYIENCIHTLGDHCSGKDILNEAAMNAGWKRGALPGSSQLLTCLRLPTPRILINTQDTP